MILAGLYMMRHDVLFFDSYNYDAFPALVQAMGRLVGVDGFLGTEVTGMSVLDRAQVICPGRGSNGNTCSGAYQKLFTASPNAPANMADAYKDLVKSVGLVSDAWNGLKSHTQPIDDYQLLDPAKIVPWQRLNQTTIDNLTALVNGQQVRNAVTGALTTINIPKFYAAPPSDLKMFMPVAFDASPRTLAPIDGFTDIRNYTFGESTGWDPAVYSPYFADVETGSEVPTVMKNVAQTFGGWLVNTPLAIVSMVF
jgi:hypothetical protein